MRWRLCDGQGGPVTRVQIVRWYGARQCRESARSVYTALKFYTDQSIRTFKDNNPLATQEAIQKYKDNSNTRWKKLPTCTKEKWEAVAREHDNRQPTIKDAIIDSLQRNAHKSFEQVENDIGGWCSRSTIQRWLSSYASFQYYTERIIPLLTKQQQAKHVQWSMRFRNHWGIGWKTTVTQGDGIGSRKHPRCRIRITWI